MQATGTPRHLLQNDGAEAAADAPAAVAASPPPPARRPPQHPNVTVTPQGAPPNITVVNTADELQRALLSAAVDIEIRSHLDLRPIALAPNPMIQGLETANNRKRIALLYATPPLRSIRVRVTPLTSRMRRIRVRLAGCQSHCTAADGHLKPEDLLAWGLRGVISVAVPISAAEASCVRHTHGYTHGYNRGVHTHGCTLYMP